MARVLLLNPPVSGRPVLRDFACGESTKADYYWAPIDLLVLSGILAAHHDVLVIDAVADPVGPDTVVDRARAFDPAVVFSLTAVVSLESDDAFLTRLKRETGARVYGMGDVASFAAEAGLQRTLSFDGFVQNFGDPAMSALAAGDLGRVSSVVLRDEDGSIVKRPIAYQTPLSYPMPRHALFPLHRYRMPFTRWTRSTSVLSSYGCPFPCTFCASRELPHQLRPVAEVIDELRRVKALGLEEFYLRDFTFGPSRKRGHALASAMAEADLGLRWSSECRTDVLDEALLDRMRAAGCEIILVGIETGEEVVSRRLGKRFGGDRTRRILDHANALGIRVCGHFVLGSPAETREQILKTIDYACELPIDYASFNLYAPRLGTSMRDDLVKDGRLSDDDFGEHDVSKAANNFSAVPANELRRLFQRAALQFYFRPSQLRRLLGNTPLETLVRQGLGVSRLLLESRA